MTVAVDEYDLIASISRESFFEFFKEFWPEIVQDQPLILNWHIEYICKQMQKAAELVFAGKPKEYDIIINIPPSTSKSSIASIAFPAWVMCRMPSARCICTSHTDSLALDLSRKSRDVVRSDKYQSCFGIDRKFRGRVIPAVEIADDQDTKGYWATSRGGMRFTATVGGKSPTGQHGHFLISDDVIDPKKILSETELKETNRWMMETLPTRKVNKLVSVSFLIMQRLHMDDPTGHRLANKKAGPIKHICLPADTSYEIKPSYLKANYIDGLFDPVRLPREVLETEEALLGEFAYSGQFGQSPLAIGGNLFKWEQIKYDTPPFESDFRQIVRSWDTAGELTDTSARTAGVKMGKDSKGRFWILDVIVGRWSSERREDIILSTARRDGKKVKIIVEQQGGSSGKEVVRATIRMLAGFVTEADKPTGDKATRAIPFSVQVNNGNVYIPLEAPWAQEYIDELKFFPASKLKDQCDASSCCFNALTKRAVVGGVRGL